MTLYSVPVVAMAAISALVGIFFISIYLRSTENQIVGSFALVCFAVVVYDIGCIGLYNSNDFTSSAGWQRIQFVGVALLTVTLSFFYHKLTGKMSALILIIITSINILFVIVGYTIKSQLTLSPEYTAEKYLALGGLLSLHILEVQPGIIYDIQVIFSFTVFSTIIFGLIKFLKNFGHGKTVVVVAMIILYLAVINDSLISMGLSSYPYFFEYSFAALIISMTQMFIDEFLKLHNKVKNINRSLEETVNERTRELKILSGLLPICSYCKKIRDDKGYWTQIESYIHKRSEAQFSHGICEECAKKNFPDMNLYGDEQTQDG